MFANVCRETGAKVVLSSSWRLAFTTYIEEDAKPQIRPASKYNFHAAQLMDYFDYYGIELVGLTTSHYDYRGRQIEEYVKKNLTSDDKWVVLDDDVSDIYGYVPSEQIVATDYTTGLQQKHCDYIIHYFRA